MKAALAGLALLLSLATGCSYTGSGARIPLTSTPTNLSVETLKRNEYVVLDAVEGQARFKYSTFLHFFKTQDPKNPTFDETKYQVSAIEQAGLVGGIFAGISSTFRSITSLFFGTEILPDNVREQAEARAAHDALNKMPDADTLISPRFNWDWKIHDYFFGADYEATVTCRGKAIRIKTGDLPYTQMFTPDRKSVV